ncbi:BV6 family protein [Diolcogaster facetosa bracovirus]|uniref:BV6 family protein n=3 Tax=Bracoviriform TaxID=2946836 RepID=R9XNG5_9VIRU|nr:BV6 family protein [Diolcogaster facetosa bracovirus] [Bracoviriform facetosae]AGO14380.1 BV6 family protein [Diolcogaster facetosa bracovirus] [Bracoviriform facetosae]AGO14454.1 BV6 family protein [Cotesia sesamiae Mombasa bracovirus]
MFIDGKYHYNCVAPKEWAVHKKENLEKMMVDSCLDHRKKTTCIHEANTKISSVSTKLEYYNLKLWFKRTDDISASPNSGSYFSMLLHLPESKCK